MLLNINKKIIIMSKKRILVVDDELDLREILQFNLENEGYEVETAANGEEALEMLAKPFDLILLDVMMDGISGLKVADKAHKELNIQTPIIFITAKATENDMLTGFSIGADDYITKPFSIKEVIVRCRAILRRSEYSSPTVTPQKQIIIGDMVINTDDREVRIKGDILPLTKKEYEILNLMTSYMGHTFSREDILSKVWRDETFVLERTVDVHIARLRKKLGSVGNCIVNRSGYGYLFKTDNADKL